MQEGLIQLGVIHECLTQESKIQERKQQLKSIFNYLIVLEQRGPLSVEYNNLDTKSKLGKCWIEEA